MQESCSICLEKLDDNKCTLPCGHCFHSTCAIKSFRVSNKCPLCRNETVEQEPERAITDIIQIISERTFQESMEQRALHQRNVNLVRRIPGLRALKIKMMERKKIEDSCKKELNRIWSIKVKELKKDPDILLLRNKYDKARRNHLRAYHIFHRNINEHI